MLFLFVKHGIIVLKFLNTYVKLGGNMENDINSKTILDEFTVFKTEHQLDEWMQTKKFLFKEASQILQEGNSTIVYSTKYRYQEKLKHLGITDNDDVECSLTSYIDPDEAKILKKSGIGAGIGALAAMTFGGPIGWITVIGGALGAGAGRKNPPAHGRGTA